MEDRYNIQAIAGEKQGIRNEEGDQGPGDRGEGSEESFETNGEEVAKMGGFRRGNGDGRC